MTSWGDVQREAPGFAARVQKLFDAGVNKIIATIRADGSPRVSGIEAQFTDGELTFGSMPDARKGADLRRDPRFAMHGPSPDPPADNVSWAGDAKIAGRAVPVGEVPDDQDGDQEGQQYRADISEVVITHLNESATKLVIETWRPGGGVRRVERA